MQKFITPNDFLNGEDLKIYKESVYPFNLRVLYNKLMEKLKEDPDFEIWVSLHYYRWERAIKTSKNKELLAPPTILISNRGRVYDKRRKAFINTRRYGEDWYNVFSLNYGKRIITFTVHRAIGCSFIPVPEKYGIAGFYDLVINHIDGKKPNNDMDNLEWVTQLDNNIHALDNGLRFGVSGWKNNRSKPVKGTILEGPHKGLEFIICGAKDAKQHGFFMAGISLSCLGGCPAYRNCSWVWATAEEIEKLDKGISKEVRETIEFFKGKVKSDIEVTCIKTGNVFIITRGYPEILELGFNPSEVTAVVKGRRKTHKGHKFARI